METKVVILSFALNSSKYAVIRFINRSYIFLKNTCVRDQTTNNYFQIRYKLPQRKLIVIKDWVRDIYHLKSVNSFKSLRCTLHHGMWYLLLGRPSTMKAKQNSSCIKEERMNKHVSSLSIHKATQSHE